MKRRLMALLLAGLLLAGLAGCGGAGAAAKAEPTEVIEATEPIAETLPVEEPTTEPTEPQGPETVGYLVDVAEIGEYVEIGVDYTNCHGREDRESAQTAFTGWRVLSKEGSGETGTVTLIAAGSPLSYYFPYGDDGDATIAELGDLYKTIDLENTRFFENGFSSEDLAAVFDGSGFVDTAKGVHAFGCADGDNGTATDGEIERAYAYFVGEERSLHQIREYTEANLGDFVDEFGDETLGLTEDSPAAGLLANGGYYFLGGAPYYTGTPGALWCIGYEGWIELTANVIMGIRPVVTLLPGLTTLQGENGAWELYFS